ncbi:MAG: Repeat domain in Vibrio, Colwellia, Bradyrhizobium and Shewanella, partial [Proteobacteria bacterium]|nr:Repeat domain in Vibrio, Colwellia, Bradyrhizobium and Shewanella [Pseudomonadota bacterium]
GYWSPGWTVHAGDFDGDGASDIFVYSTTTGQWYQCISDKSGYFGSYYTGNWSAVWQVQVSDFNNDGKSDVFLHYPDWGVYYLCITGPTAGTFLYYPGVWEPKPW